MSEALGPEFVLCSEEPMQEHPMPDDIAAPEPVRLTVADATFEEIVRRLGAPGTRVVVEDGGVPVAAVISPADLARFSHYEAERARRLVVIDEARAAFDDVPPDELEAEVANALAEARAERRRASTAPGS